MKNLEEKLKEKIVDWMSPLGPFSEPESIDREIFEFTEALGDEDGKYLIELILDENHTNDSNKGVQFDIIESFNKSHPGVLRPILGKRLPIAKSDILIDLLAFTENTDLLDFVLDYSLDEFKDLYSRPYRRAVYGAFGDSKMRKYTPFLEKANLVENDKDLISEIEIAIKNTRLNKE